jgi:hypothetical protein
LIGEVYTSKGVDQFLRNKEGAVQKAFEMSAFLRNRASTFNRDVRDAHKTLGVSGMNEEIVTAAFMGIQLLDTAVSVPSWLGAYQKATDEGQIGQAAIDFADGVVARGQGGEL